MLLRRILKRAFSSNVNLSTAELPKLYKFSGMQVDYNDFFSELPAIRQNVINRKAKVDLDYIAFVYQKYCDLKKQISTLNKRIIQHSDLYRFYYKFTKIENKIYHKLNVIISVKSNQKNIQESPKVFTTNYTNMKQICKKPNPSSMYFLFSYKKSLILKLPNWTHPSVPLGPQENAKLISLHGKKRIFSHSE